MSRGRGAADARLGGIDAVRAVAPGRREEGAPSSTAAAAAYADATASANTLDDGDDGGAMEDDAGPAADSDAIADASACANDDDGGAGAMVGNAVVGPSADEGGTTVGKPGGVTVCSAMNDDGDGSSGSSDAPRCAGRPNPGAPGTDGNVGRALGGAGANDDGDSAFELEADAACAASTIEGDDAGTTVGLVVKDDDAGEPRTEEGGIDAGEPRTVGGGMEGDALGANAGTGIEGLADPNADVPSVIVPAGRPNAGTGSDVEGRVRSFVDDTGAAKAGGGADSEAPGAPVDVAALTNAGSATAAGGAAKTGTGME